MDVVGSLDPKSASPWGTDKPLHVMIHATVCDACTIGGFLLVLRRFLAREAGLGGVAGCQNGGGQRLKPVTGVQ